MKKYLAMSIVLLLLITLGAVYRTQLSQVRESISGGKSRSIIVHIPLHSWSFEPDHIEATAGDTLSVTVINEDDIPHGFAIEEYRVRKSIAAFSTTTLPTITLQKDGKFQFYCSEICGDGNAESGVHKGEKRGHFDMTGQLNVASK